MSNYQHGLTVKDADGRTKAHPLYWVWHEKKKRYDMSTAWRDSVSEFADWAQDNLWEKGDSIRRIDSKKSFSPANCYVHAKGTALGVKKS